MPDTQRDMELQTGAGEGLFVLDSMAFTETIGQPFQMTLRVRLSKPDVDIYQLMGKAVVVRMRMVFKEDPMRWFHGFVRSIREPGPREARRVFRLSVVPTMSMMDLTTDSRIFQEKTIKDIVSEVLGNYKIEFAWRATGQTVKRKICVQYRESDLQFVMRLLEQSGLSFFHEHTEQKHTLVIAAEPETFKKSKAYPRVGFSNPGPGDADSITEIHTYRMQTTEKVIVSDFDFMKPATSLETEQPLGATDRLMKTHRYEYPGEYWEMAEGQALCKRIAHELTSQSKVITGESKCRGLSAGTKFELADPMEALIASLVEQELLVTSVTIMGQNSELSSEAGGESHVDTSFTAIFAAQDYCPPRVTPKPVAVGPQTAKVVGPSGEEIYTDKHGRVRVHFHWDRQGKGDEKDTCWVRVSQGWAGKGFGMFFLPRIGHEVIVEFIDGDPDRPIITGCVHNADQTPPYALPDMKTVSTIKTLSSNGGGGFHEIRFEDKKDSEMMFVHAQKDFDRRVLNDMKTFVGANRHDTITGDLAQKIDGAVGQAIGGALSVEVGEDYSLKVGGKTMIEVGGNTSLKVGGNLNQKMTDLSIDAGGGVMIKGASGIVLDCSAGITLKCGGSSVVLDSSGVTIKGSLVTLDGSMIKIASGPGSPPGGGPACSIEAPAAPAAAEEPINAEPGAMIEYQAEQKQRAEIALEPIPGMIPLQEKQTDPEEEKTWIEIEVIDSEGEKVKNESVKVLFSSGKIVSKKTDGNGLVRIDDLVPADSNPLIDLPDREDPEYDKVAEVESGDDTKPLADPEPEPGPVEPGEDVYTEVPVDEEEDDGAPAPA